MKKENISNMIGNVYNEDCLETMKRMEDNSIDLILTDPPYGINIAEWDSEVPPKEYFDEIFRISKHQIIFGGNYFELPHTNAWLC
jgi:site-specific DNA-methyltransferase (adenine-specific)